MMRLSVFNTFVVAILLTHNIILVNEESLILICFIITVAFIISKFNYLTNSMFQKYKIHQKENLVKGLNTLNLALNKIVSRKENKVFLTNLMDIKSYWTKFGKNLIYWSGINLIYKTRFSFVSCFRSLKYNESKITKLLNLALNKDLNKKIIISHFVETEFLSLKLKAQNLIVVREWLQFNKIIAPLF